MTDHVAFTVSGPAMPQGAADVAVRMPANSDPAPCHRPGSWAIPREGTAMHEATKPCEFCGESFSRKPQYSRRQWTGARFCSKSCAQRGKYPPESVRFWAKVDKCGPDECWVWQAATTTHGYGVFLYAGRLTGAHRVSWEMAFGPIPDGTGYHGTCVLHRCDNPPCVNPAHLFLGSNAENIADMRAKERNNRGAKNGQAKLTPEQVREIRRRASEGGEDHPTIAADFGVSATAISNISRGKRWAWLV